MHRSVHLSRGKKGERTYWQGEAFSNRLAPVPRAPHPLGHGLPFIMERNKTGRATHERVCAAGMAILKRSVNFIPPSISSNVSAFYSTSAQVSLEIYRALAMG